MATMAGDNSLDAVSAEVALVVLQARAMLRAAGEGLSEGDRSDTLLARLNSPDAA
jgi:hypothetical protein